MTTDSYAYLEDGTDPATLAWQEAQNRRTRAALDAVPHRTELRARFERLTRTGALGAPVVRGDVAFFSSRTGDQDQPVISLAAAGSVDRVLLDPMALDPSGLTAIDWWSASPRGRYLAYGLSRNGDEKSTLHLLDVTGATEPVEAIPDTRYASVAWLPDESGFYYTRRPAGSDYDVRLRFHALAAPQAEDRTVFGEGRPKEDGLAVVLSANGRWLIVTAQHGWSHDEVFVADLRSAAGETRFTAVFEGVEARAELAPSGDRFVLFTTDGAPNGRVYEIDPERLERAAWREIVPEGADPLHFAVPTAAGILLGSLHDVASRLALRTPSGTIRELPLGLASIQGLSADEASSVAHVVTTSFFTPARVRRLELGEAGVRVLPWRELASDVDPAAYDVEQTWCRSSDGTRVPIFVLSRAGAPRDGSAPGIVYGYGGFNVALTPDFMPTVTPWLEAGGVYAIATLRGGSEFGEAWHRAGMRERKQNVFDDFAAAIEHLGAEGFVDPARVAVSGGSNGGLLVAALATQRPALARAVVCAVPVIDMLRYHLFSIGRMWIPEYGDPDVPADAAFLRAYSPYENVRGGTAYPAMLILSAMADSRVDPMHARKFAAKVQAALRDGGDAPRAEAILCHIEADAGHGQGKPRHKQLDELVDRFAFLAAHLGVDPARLAGIAAGAAHGL